MIEWHLHWKRSIPVGRGVLTPQAAPQLKTRSALYKKVIKRQALTHAHWQDVIVPPDYHSALQTLNARMTSDEKNLEHGLNHKVEALAFHTQDSRRIADHQSDPKDIVDFWLVTEGPAFAITALIDAWNLHFQFGTFKLNRGGYRKYRSNVLLTITDREWDLSPKSNDPFYLAFKHLRRRMASLSSVQYAQARLLARHLYSQSDLSVRLGICFLFPLETEWAVAVKRTIVRQPKRYVNPGWSLLVGSLDPQEACELIVYCCNWDARSHLNHILARHGLGAADAILSMGRRLLEQRDPMGWACIEVLGQVKTPSIRGWMEDIQSRGRSFEIKRIGDYLEPVTVTAKTA